MDRAKVEQFRALAKNSCVHLESMIDALRDLVIDAHENIEQLRAQDFPFLHEGEELLADMNSLWSRLRRITRSTKETRHDAASAD